MPRLSAAEPSDFLAAFDALVKRRWYLHHTPEGRYYFDRQENLTKLLAGARHRSATDPYRRRSSDIVCTRCSSPSRKTVYDEVIPLPRLDDVADRVARSHPHHCKPGLADAARGGADASSRGSARRTTCAC